ncbi:MAG: EamA family transporter [Bryobacteraceae bacterium]
MPALGLSPFGLLLAAAMSVTNVFTDVARKHALERRDLVPATFWIRVAVAAVFVLVLAWRVEGGAAIEIRDTGPLFGVAFLSMPTLPTFFVYLVLDVSLITIVMWLYFRALQISPMSLCVPFLSFTPVFLIFTTFVLLGEKIAPLKSLGIVLIVVGSLVMHRRLFAIGWLAPVKAVIREKGSRYMLLVSFIFSITNPLDKKLVLMSDIYVESVAYGLGLCVSFWLLGRLQKSDFAAAARGNWKWISLAGLSDAVSLLFQLASYTYLAVAITVSIKRAGIILAVIAGWMFFREKGITDKVIAASVMFCGVLILYLPLTAPQAGVLTLATLAGMSAALYATRHREVTA